MTKPYEKKDPFQKREAEKYEHPVPSREFIMDYCKSHGEPLSFNQLLTAFDLPAAEEEEGLRRRLKAMERDGQLLSNRRGKYALVTAMALVSGSVQGHRDGFGFLITDDDGSDVFLPAREMRSLFPSDRVLVRITSPEKRQRREGVVVEVLESNTKSIVGKFCQEKGICFVDPDDKNIAQDVIVPAGDQGKAKNGDYVLLELLTQPSKRRQPTGKVIEILGNQLTPGMEVELSIRSHNIPVIWPDAAKKQANKFKAAVQKKELKHRTDFRDMPFVTIDGEDAKDFDDAVYCEPHEAGGWKLYVAIADVSHYVKPTTALDKEAEERGNSVYFPTRVIPMLPEILSNELCSLKPNVDRLAVVCEMLVNQKAEVTDYQFHNGVIHSHARLTYNQVASWLSGEKKPNDTIFPHIQHLNQLYRILLKQKKHRGAIEFETTETQIIFGKKGKIDRIIPTERNDAHKMIEEAMLLANVTTSNFLEKSELVTLYRIHASPEETRLIALRDFLKAFGLRLAGGGKPTGQDYANLLSRISKRPDAHLLQMVMLRSLPKAVYHTENIGHFGLSYDGYCHFTSPIRRYPDLLVHRAIKHLLDGGSKKSFQYTTEIMDEYAKHSSETERRADLATRDATDWLKCDYMMDKLGKEFEGLIIDVTGFGVFVELNNIYVQGLLHITSLSNDYYEHDATHHLLRGKRSGKVYRLGDTIQVLVARVDLDQRKIDFELPNSTPKNRVEKSKKNQPTQQKKQKNSRKKPPRKK
jgi:ribonuclease R